MASQPLVLTPNYVAESVPGMHSPQSDEMRTAAKQRLKRQIDLAKKASFETLQLNRSSKATANSEKKWTLDPKGNWLQKI